MTDFVEFLSRRASGRPARSDSRRADYQTNWKFAQPADEREAKAKPANEGRWLQGLYLDKPEEWDDPYRFLRW
jgi:hypothetical protein